MTPSPPGAGNPGQNEADTAVHSIRFDGPPSEAIIELMDEIWDEPIRESKRLYDVIDIEALDRLIAHKTRSSQWGDLWVTFPYRGYELTVYSYGVIRATPSPGDRERPG